MAGTFIATGSYSNLTRLELEQLRRGDYAAGGKALTIGDSGLSPEGVVGPGSVNAESFYSAPYTTFEEIVNLLPPDSPGKMLGKTFEVYSNGDIGSWLGPQELTRAVGSSAILPNTTQLTDAGADFVTDGVQAGDLLLIYLSIDVSVNFATASVASVDSATQITCSNIVLSGGGTAFPAGPTAVYEYAIVRPDAVQLFAVPGSGPLGQEQTFLFVDPASALHANAGPTVDQINADRITNIIPPKYNKDATVDRADAVYRSPAPGSALTAHGYRIVLYPDDGTGTGPDLSSPITALNPVIDPAIPAADQRMTVDYVAGVIRFSCAPAIGGDIKVSGGVNGTTGRLNLYAVAWCFNRTADNNASAYRLYEPTATETALGLPAQIKWESPTWAIRGLKSDGGQSLIKVAGNTAADQQLRIREVEAPNTASIVGKLNAQLVTVGNGTTTFGDYNGATAIEDAFTAAGGAALTIRVKAGTYSLTGLLEVENDLNIIGESVNTVILNVNSPASDGISIASSSKVTLENLQVRKGTATTSRIQIHGLFRAKNCLFRNTYLWITQTQVDNFPIGVTVLTPGGDSVLVEDSVLDGSGDANQSPIRFLVEDPSSPVMRGFRFKNCVIRGADTGDALAYVQNDIVTGFGSCTIKDITFENCQLQPHACASTSSTVIAKPSGVFYADPASTVDELIIDDLKFINCNVTVATNGTAVGNTVLMHVMPIAYNAANTTNRVIYGTVRIEGGTWQTPSGRGTNVAPFFLQCLNPIVEGVKFIASGTASTAYDTAPGYLGNGTYTNAQKIALRSTVLIAGEAPIGWATFAASGEAIEAQPIATRLTYTTGMTVRGVTVSNIARLGGNTAVVFCGPSLQSGPARIDGVHIVNPAANTTNANTGLIKHWFGIFTGGSGTTARGTNGYFRNLVFRAPTNTLTAGARWADFSLMEVSPEGPLTLENIVLDGSPLNGDTSAYNDCVGMRIAWTWTSSTLPAIQHGPFLVRGATIRYVRNGITTTAAGVTCTQPLGPWKFEDVLIEHNTTQPASFINPDDGVRLDYGSTIPGGMFFRNCEIRVKIRSTGDAAIYHGWMITAQTFQRQYHSAFIGCRTLIDAFSNFMATGTAGIYIDTFGASSEPAFEFTGNKLMGIAGGFSPGPMAIKLTRASGAALSDNTLGGGAYYVHAETGHTTAASNQYRFQTGQPMVHNDATLVTP